MLQLLLVPESGSEKMICVFSLLRDRVLNLSQKV